MQNESPLAEKCVSDVWNLVVRQPSTVTLNDSIRHLLQITIADTRTRHTYVIDANRILIGCVRMNALVEYLFPIEAIVRDVEQAYTITLNRLPARTIEELMDPKPKFVHPFTPLSEVANILMEEKINELPIVDDSHRLVGQVNIYEMIMSYLDPHL